MDICKDYVQLDDFEATVITLEMIQEAIGKSAKPEKTTAEGVQSTLVAAVQDEVEAESETELDQVERLMLPVKGIYRIDYLWVLPNLTELNLSCNNIQFIENINCLHGLTKLNLSCNKIKKIEHLDQLLQIRILIIHNNQITIIENIDNMKELRLINIKNNLLRELEENVLYLRQFKNLKSLCITGNPCCQNIDSFEGYIIAHLPGLVYLEYKLIKNSDRKDYRAQFENQIQQLVLEEEKTKRENNREENEERNFHEQKLAFVENLNKHELFDLMRDRDPYSHIIVMMKGDMPSIYEKYQQELFSYTQDLFQMGKDEFNKREHDINQFVATFDNLKRDLNIENRKIVEDFITKKAFIFYDIAQIIRDIEQSEVAAELPDTQAKVIADENEPETMNKDGQSGDTINRSLEVKNGNKTLISKHRSTDTDGPRDNHTDKILALNEIFHDACNKAYEDLMRNEDTLHEQLEDLIRVLDGNLETHVDNFVRKSQLLFTNIRDIEKTYINIIKEFSRKFFNKNIGNVTIPAQLKQILQSQDTLNNALDISDRAQLDTIDDREETMLNNITQWHKELIGDKREEEVERHRKCVNEICHLIDINREELDDIINDVPLGDPQLLI